MKRFLSVLLLLGQLHAYQAPMNFSMVISGGVSLGAYEAGYNWTIMRILSQMRTQHSVVTPDLKSVVGASAGSINALLTAIYWCQREDVPELNSIDDNLYYDTWVELGIEDLMVKEGETQNKSALFSRRVLKKKAQNIIAHLKKPIFQEGCEIPMGFTVTKVRPIVEMTQGVRIKSQSFSVPLDLYVKEGRGHLKNRKMPESTANYLAIPGLEKDPSKISKVLFASSAFPGAFQQVKLDYLYKGRVSSAYFMDGGVYNNIPLDLALELGSESNYFFLMDPSNIRKEREAEETKEQAPIGFLNSSISVLGSTIDTYQQMNFYDTIDRFFSGNSQHTLVLSSRFHPITGGFLEHFGAFLDINFRIYDYYVGVYDAIYQFASSLRRKGYFAKQSQIQTMDRIVQRLHISPSSEAMKAYRFFLATEFGLPLPEGHSRYSTIYFAFDLKARDEDRYGAEAFKQFLKKIDLRYFNVKPGKFLQYAKRDVEQWYRKPLRYVVNRITKLEDERAKVYPKHAVVADILNVGAFAGSTFIEEKSGLQIFPLSAPHDKELAGLRMALRLLPSELAVDTVHGGMSLAYEIYWYQQMGFLDGFELKPSYNFQSETSDFIRLDANSFIEYEDFVKLGGGISMFANMQSDPFGRDGRYGANLYIDFLDIFRATYVRRFGDAPESGYFYLGVRNLPSLFYWLYR